MKKILLYVFVIIAIIGLYIGSYYFYLPNLTKTTFENKRDSLETNIKRKIKEAWNNSNALLFFKDYGGAEYIRMDMDVVRYIDNRKDTEMPAYNLTWDLFPNGRYGNSVRKAFNSLRPGNFNDLYDLYYVKSIPWRGTFIAPDNDLYNIKIFTYTPLFVGYKKETISLREYRPSFDTSCKEAKKYIQEEDADNRMYYNEQNEEKANRIFNLRNDYYYFQLRDINRTFQPDIYTHEFDFSKFNFRNHYKFDHLTGTVNWVYNDFYKVYYLSQRVGNMYLTFNETKYNQDFDSYLSSKRTICNVILFICLGILGYFILMAFIKFKRDKIIKFTTEESSSIKIEDDTKNSTNKDSLVIYNKVIELSNPEKFIKPYQPEKLEKANRIYSTALNNKDNVDVLVKLLEEAVKL